VWFSFESSLAGSSEDSHGAAQRSGATPRRGTSPSPWVDCAKLWPQGLAQFSTWFSGIRDHLGGAQYHEAPHFARTSDAQPGEHFDRELGVARVIRRAPSHPVSPITRWDSKPRRVSAHPIPEYAMEDSCATQTLAALLGHGLGSEVVVESWQ
jgi:hypothetical protein